MNKLLLVIFLLAELVLAQNSKINIAVLDLDATNIKDEDARFLSDRLRIELFDAGIFNVLERDKMNVILQEQGFQLSGCTSVECAVEVGQLLNVQQMVAGSIGRIGNVYSISLRLIKVKTGELVKTAKHDYQGELSDMLTEVLPEIAQELSSGEGETSAQPVQTSKTKRGRWGIQIKPAVAVFTVVTDFNKRIDKFNSTFEPDLDNLSQFAGLGIIAVWDYDATWRYNFGIQISSMTKDWAYKIRNYTAVNGVIYDRVEFGRKFTFANIYADVDYKIALAEKLNLFLGAGLGLNSLTSKVNQRFEPADGSQGASDENEYSYVVLAIRIKAGFDYILNDHFTFLVEFCPVLQPEYDTKDEYLNQDAYEDFRQVLYPETMNGSGVILGFGVTYYF